MGQFKDFINEAKDNFTFHFAPQRSSYGNGSGTLTAYLGPMEVGYISFYFDSFHRSEFDKVYINELHVEPRFRSRGVATRIKQEFVNYMRKKHPYVKRVESSFMSQKAFKMSNKLMGDPIYMGTDITDLTGQVDKATKMMAPDLDDDRSGGGVTAIHKMPHRIGKSRLRQLKSLYPQMDLPFPQ